MKTNEKKTKVVNFISGPSCGKCHGRDTPILMYDGRCKKVQDIKVGDILMGDDSLPRIVSSLARGREMIYRVECYNGDTFTANASHILCLKYGTDSKNDGELFSYKCETDSKEMEMSIREYLGLTKNVQDNLKCYTTKVDFEEKEVSLDPYMLGVWLGLTDNKHIPYEYKCNSRRIRLEVLAGLIDSDKNNRNGSYEIIQKNKMLAHDIVYLCKSLGFYTSMGHVQNTHYRVQFAGSGLDDIPSLCLKKKEEADHAHCRDMSLLDFTVKEVGEDEYYGFTVDKNHRYLLGNFVVSHNSTISALVYAELKMMHKSVEIVPEVAKWLIYKGEEEKLSDQHYVSSEQYKMIKALDGKVDYIIGDSGIMTGLYYNRAYSTKSVSDVIQTEQTIHSMNDEFNNIYVVIERNSEYPFEKEGRVHTEDESKIVDVEIIAMLNEFSIPYKSFLSHKESVRGIVNYILSFEGNGKKN